MTDSLDTASGVAAARHVSRLRALAKTEPAVEWILRVVEVQSRAIAVHEDQNEHWDGPNADWPLP